METYINYKGYGITYFSSTGTTYVNGLSGRVIKIFKREGELIGLQKAKQFIDEIINN